MSTKSFEPSHYGHAAENHIDIKLRSITSLDTDLQCSGDNLTERSLHRCDARAASCKWNSEARSTLEAVAFLHQPSEHMHRQRYSWGTIVVTIAPARVWNSDAPTFCRNTLRSSALAGSQS
jgi:hypothetical protein